MTPEKRSILIEQVVLWLVTLLLIRGIVTLYELGVHEIILAAVPVLFMYVPVWACSYLGLNADDFPLALPGLRDPAWREALRVNAVFIGIISLPFLVGYHFWQTAVIGFHYKGTWPAHPLMLMCSHLFFVAIPEEMYYRGFMQSRLDQVWEPRWQILKATLGPGWLLTCLLFALGHSIVQVQWWHIAIVIPSLAFGWMRARTNDVVAGALFHAWCNISVGFLDALYGIVKS